MAWALLNGTTSTSKLRFARPSDHWWCNCALPHRIIIDFAHVTPLNGEATPKASEATPKASAKLRTPLALKLVQSPAATPKAYDAHPLVGFANPCALPI